MSEQQGPAVSSPPGSAPASASPMPRAALPIRAGIISVAHHGASQLVRVASHLVLARLLSAEAFGLMGLVASCTTAVELFTDLGIAQNIIQNPRGADRTFLNTAWTIKAIRGFVLWMLAALLAWPFATFYDAPTLLFLIPIAGVTVLLSGLESTSLVSMQRSLNLGRYALLQISVQVIGSGVMIVWALVDPSVWALAAGGIASGFALVLASHLLAPGPRNYPLLDRESVGLIVKFGRWMLPATMVYFFVSASHRLILGKFVSAEQLGFFNIALFLSGFVVAIADTLGTRVLFPLFAREGRSLEHENFVRRVARARIVLLALTLPPLCVLVAWGAEIVGLLYDARYAGAGWMVQILAAGAIVDCIAATSRNLILARGDSRRHFFSMLGGAVLFAAFVVAGYQWDGWQGLVVALAAAPLARYPALAWALHRQRLWQPLLDFGALACAAAMTALFWAVKGWIASA